MTKDNPILSTPYGVVLWADLFVPRLPKEPKPDAKPKYSVRLGFTTEDMDTPEFKAIKALVISTAKSSLWGAKAEAMIKEGSVRLPFRTDIAAKGYDPRFKCFINLQSTVAPGVVSRYIDPTTGKNRKIIDPKEIWSGCLGRATVSAYAYGGGNTGFTPGVGLGLRNFCLGNVAGVTYPRLDGRTTGEEDFAGESAPDGDFDTGSSSSSSREDLSDLLN